MSADFSAAASALGYIYQCEIALLAFFRRGDPALDISIETADDVVLHGDQLSLTQVKYEVTPGTVADASARLWKTLRVWSSRELTQPEALLVLFTTAHAAAGSIAALLREGDARDHHAAHDRLVATARASTNVELEPAMTVFLKLPDDRRLAMVERMIVVDDQPVVSELGEAYDRALVHAAPGDRRAHVIARIREWWLLRAERHLDAIARGEQCRISGQEIELKLADIRDQLTAHSLPIDLEGMPEPTDPEVAADQRAFVIQLRLIRLQNRRIAIAVHDHNRAFAQRARWMREDLLLTGELDTYDARLKQEWERVFLPDTEDAPALTGNAAESRGRDVHRTCGDLVVEPIRPKVTAPYVMRGSLQLLAHRQAIGWHPDWASLMRQALAEAGA